ncbi:MAG: hypothetical protein AMXMBFR33_19850 [Candidatus Xenobia bacterium]
MKIYEYLEKLELLAQNGQSLPWPMNDRVVLYRDPLLKLLSRAREELPQEVKDAHWILQERDRIAQESTSEATHVVRQAGSDADRILRDAEEKAREILRTAREESQRLVQESEVMARAREEGRKLLEETRDRCQRLQGESQTQAREVREASERFAAGVLNGMEGELSRILAIIKKHQETLKSQREEAQPPRTLASAEAP